MERNYSADTYGYYKEPINCQTNITYNEVYHQATHAANNSIPYEAEYKDRRYVPPQNNVYYDGNYKAETNYKIDKNLQSYRPSAHTKHSTDSYKDSAYYSQYYDPYKLNANISPVVNIQPQVPKPKDSYYHGAHATNQFPTSKIQSTYCDENILQQQTKANLSKTSSCQVPPPQYMYSNCYNYPTSSGYTNQTGYCAYPQSCNDETKVYWDEYQNSRRLMQSTYSQPTHTQQNCSLKDNHTSLDYYKANNFPCQAESFHAREKSVYGVGSHSSNTEHLYNNRTSWPPSMQYQSMPPHLPNALERSNYYHETQNYDCCAALPPTQPLPQPHHSHAPVTHSLMPQQRQDNSANFYSNYGKYLQHPPSHSIPPQVNQLKYGRSQQHSPTASVPSVLSNAANMYNSQRYYMYNEQNSSMNSYQPNYPKDDCVQAQSIGSNLIYNLDTNETNVNVTYSIEDKNIVYKNYQPPQVDVNGAYGKSGYHPSMMNSLYQENQKNQLTRSQNLREFLSSWNEDEDDGCEKIDLTTQGTMPYPGNGLCGKAMSGISNGMMNGIDYDMNSMKTGPQVPGVVNNATGMENHLQFKSTFATRPKIHVGITVDSNVSNSQYINLPDIIIDIEKSKETESIQSTVELNSAPTAKLNEKTVIPDAIDEPKVAENLEEVAKEDCREVTLKTSTGTETSDLSMISEPFLETSLPECDDLNELAATTVDDKTQLINDHSKTFGLRNTKKMKKWAETIKRKDNRHWKKKFKHVYALEKINLQRLAKLRKMKRMKLRSKLVNIKKLSKKPRKDKFVSQSSAEKNFPVKTTKKDQSSSLYNPDSLKTLCITTINTEEFRNLMMSLYELEITTYQEQDSIDLDAGPSVENYEEQYNVAILNDDGNYHNFNSDETDVSTQEVDPSKVPKLSALCEYALKDVYEQNLFIINLDDENLSSSNNIYLVECDVNENITDFEEITNLTTSTIEESPQELNKETATEETVESINETDTIDCNIIENNNNIDLINNNNNNNNNYSLNNYTDPNSGDHILKDLSSIHHEEIVPENYELFKNQNLRNYLHNKYVQKTNFLQVIVINKILKKYQRYLMKKRRGKNFLKNLNKRSK